MTEGTHRPKPSDVPDWRRKGPKVGLTITKKVARSRAAAHSLLLRLGDKARVRTSAPNRFNHCEFPDNTARAHWPYL